MKTYMALNEGGTHSDIALHTKLAILSALRHTDLELKMLYIGERNSFTEWLEAHDVEVMDQQLPYLDLIRNLSQSGKYSEATVGHWLRTNVCLAEQEEKFILYTDVDVIFRKNPRIGKVRPTFFAAAPEFDKDSWNYFNAGVMVINVPNLRAEYPEFELFLREQLEEKTYSFHDQIAYNNFYRGRWDRLDLNLNWKPYWGVNDEAEIIHFHGPKIGAIEAIVDGRWNWESGHGKQIGSIFTHFLADYVVYTRLLAQESVGLSNEEQDRLHRLADKVEKFVPSANHKGSIQFMNFKMFSE